jgi:hypothetical protein
MKLTFDSIRAIAPVPPKTEIIVFDDDVPGFGVRASLSGWKVFIVQYSIGNKQRRISLGNVDEVNVDEARQQAREILVAVRMGKYPAGDERPWPDATNGLKLWDAQYVASLAASNFRKRTVKHSTMATKTFASKAFRKALRLLKPNLAAIFTALPAIAQ